MEIEFIVFWRLYAPMKKYANRYRACERLWQAKDQRSKEWIIRELEKAKAAPESGVRTKNPYFYLIDWEPPQPHWLSPKETGHLLAAATPLAVCRNPQTNCFGTVTKEEADMFGLEVHHFM